MVGLRLVPEKIEVVLLRQRVKLFADEHYTLSTPNLRSAAKSITMYRIAYSPHSYRFVKLRLANDGYSTLEKVTLR
jgi:hypothetical protein